jgi:spoIIIJ-associated protein
MSRDYIATADTVEAATALALAELKISEDEASIEVLEEPGKKLFGGRKDAVVKVVVKEAAAATESADELTADEATDIVEELPEKSGSATGREINDLQAIDELSDEQIDAIADVGIEHLKKLISYLSDGGVSIEEFEGDEGEIILDVTGEDVGVLIGRHGRTIDALQAIVSAMTTRKTGIRYPLAVDVEGYKHRRKQKVVEIARRAADRARRTNRPVSLKAMTPHERRIVHMTLKSQEGVISTSEGSGSYRHIVVVPT